jgi:hypothetical protein
MRKNGKFFLAWINSSKVSRRFFLISVNSNSIYKNSKTQILFTMKKLIALLFLVVAGTSIVQAQEMTTQTFNEWKIVTVVESIVPMGLGRSRMIENMTDVNTADYRTSRVDGKTSSQRSVSRKELKVDKFSEYCIQ